MLSQDCNPTQKTNDQVSGGLFEFISDGYLVTDSQGTIEAANDAALDLFHLSRPQILGRSLAGLVAEKKSRDLLISRLQALENLAQPRSVDICLQDAHGRPFEALLSVMTSFDPRGPADSLCWLIRDVSRQRRIEQDREALAELNADLARERDYLDAIMENARISLAYLDADFNFVKVNSAYAEDSGYPREALLGHNHFDLFPHPENQAIFQQARDTGRPVEFKARAFEFPDQPERGVTYWDWTLTPVKDAQGEVAGLVLALQDVTGKVQAEQERERLVAILEKTPDMISTSTPDGHVLYVNQAVREALAIPDDADLSQTKICDGHPPWAQAIIEKEGIPAAIRDGLWQGRCAFLTYDGREIPVSQVIISHRGSTGEVEYLSTIARDLRHEEKMLAQLEAERARLQAIIENAPQGIVVADGEACVVLANPAASQICGQPVLLGSDLGHQGDLHFYHPGGAPYEPQDVPLTRSARHGEVHSNVEMFVLRSDGQRRNLLVNTAPFYDSRDRIAGAVGVFQDITERRRVEDALRQARTHLEERVHERTVELVHVNEMLQAEIAERRQVEKDLRASEERFRQLAENITEVVWLIDPATGIFLYVSPAYDELWGRPRQALYDHPEAFLQGVHPEDRERITSAFRSGWLHYDQEFRILRPNGTQLWIRSRAFPIRDEQGEVYRIAGIAEDITSLKQAQAAIVQAERLAMAGQLAASLAHEINNPLQSVIGCLDLGREALDEGQDPRPFLGVASDALDRAARVVAQLRTLHRRSRMEDRMPTDVNDLLEQVLLLSKKQYDSSGVQVAWQPGPDLPTLPLMPGAMQQVFLNLVMNAIDAMPGGGSLQIRTTWTSNPPGISVEFQDSGVGIPPEIIDTLFEPFQTTKPEGLGLGLFISQNIIRQHGGLIEAQSERDEGAIFTVWLPA